MVFTFGKPKFPTKYCFSNPSNKYEFFQNDYAFFTMSKLGYIVAKNSLMNSACQIYNQVKSCTFLLNEIKKENTEYFEVKDVKYTQLSTKGLEYLQQMKSAHLQVSKNANSQKQCVEIITECKEKLCKLENIPPTNNAIQEEINHQKVAINTILSESETKLGTLQLWAAKKRLQRANGRISKQSKRGRPKKVPDVSNILKLVAENNLSGASERRRTAQLVCYCNGMKLFKQVNGVIGARYFVAYSTSGLRRYLVPRNRNTREGKRHDVDASVVLRKPQNDLTVEHVDLHITHSLNKYLKMLQLLCIKECYVFSVDEKAGVPTKGAAISKSTLVAMTSASKISIPDHSFSVGSNGNGITPNVGAFLHVQEVQGKLQYFVDRVLIRCRSKKNFLKTVEKDDMLADLIFFIVRAIEIRGELCPVFFLSTDNDVKVAPQNRKNQMRIFYLFKLFNFDAVVHSSFAAGGSKYNRVERTMTTLSKSLSGVVDLDKGLLPTEQANHSLALTNLCNIFSSADPVLIEAYPCSVYKHEPIPEVEDWPSFEHIDAFLDKKIGAVGVREEEKVKKLIASMHAHSVQGNGLNIFNLRKCSDPNCCPPRKASVYWNVLEKFDGFVPSPVPDGTGKHYLSFDERNLVAGVQLDAHFPSLKDSGVKCCSICQRRFHSNVDEEIHNLVCHPNRANIMLDSNIALDDKIQRVVQTVISGRSQAIAFESVIESAKDISTPKKKPVRRFKKK